MLGIHWQSVQNKAYAVWKIGSPEKEGNAENCLRKHCKVRCNLLFIISCFKSYRWIFDQYWSIYCLAQLNFYRDHNNPQTVKTSSESIKFLSCSSKTNILDLGLSCHSKIFLNLTLQLIEIIFLWGLGTGVISCYNCDTLRNTYLISTIFSLFAFFLSLSQVLCPC